jgi:hypothetical protein
MAAGYSFDELFWGVFLLVSLLGLFWLALHEDLVETRRTPEPTQDTTKTLRLP